jgi:8-oxo-dGTP pyrophosphatase MutT (NUDIX family)
VSQSHRTTKELLDLARRISRRARNPEDGARREAQEEACADISLDLLLAVYSIPRISQVQLMYRARLVAPHFAAGPESLEVRLFDWEDIPWAEIAFPSARWALEHWRQSRHEEVIAPFTNPSGMTGDMR